MSTIRSFEEVRRVIGPPLPVIASKIVAQLTEGARRFLAHSTLALVGTAGADGMCDLTLWGGSPGSALVLNDKTVLLPGQPAGALDRARDNMASNDHVGLNFVIPGRLTTLRVNGTAEPVDDARPAPAVGGSLPPRGIMVHIEDVYMHCGKALMRSAAWNPATWLSPASLPTAGSQSEWPSTGLTAQVRRLIELAPLTLLATAATDGTCDTSMRGDPSGSVRVLDDTTLVLGDRPGNRLVQSFQNILANNRLAVVLLVPGAEVTVQVTGTATIVSDAPFFADLSIQGKRPKLATMVHVEQVRLLGSPALRRAGIWEPETWPAPDAVPTMGTVIKEQVPDLPMPAGAIDEALAIEARQPYDDVLDQFGPPSGA